MGYWDDIKKANMNRGGNRLPAPGIFLLKISKVQILKTRTKGDAFIASFTVEAKHGENLEKLLIGATVDWYQSLQDREMGLGSVLRFVAGISGDDEATVRESAALILEEACGPQQALVGTYTVVETFLTKTKAGKDFTVHEFHPAPEGAEAALAAFVERTKKA